MTLSTAQAKPTQVQWVQWKDFVFPVSITKFEYTSDAKVATYEYAMRDGAEHERVVSYKILNISGIFLISNPDSPTDAYDNVKKLQATDDNRPGIFKHKDFGEFLCILKSLKISQQADYEQRFSAKIFPTYTFDMEFWEHTPSNSPKLQDMTSTLFPAPSVKPPNNNYLSGTTFTEADYKNYQTLFAAIRSGKITPSAKDPLWTSLYVGGKPTQIQKDAVTAWNLYNDVLSKKVIPGTKQPTWTALYVNGQATDAQKFVYNVYVTDTKNGLLVSKGEKWYVVQTSDDPVSIAKKFGTDIDALWQINRGVKVRNTPRTSAPPAIGDGVGTGGGGAGGAAFTPVVSRTWEDYRRSIGNGNVTGLFPNYSGQTGPYHGGMDIDGNAGDKIYAFSEGLCSRAEYRTNGYGLQVYIQSSDGYTQIYGHLSAIFPAEDPNTSNHMSALVGTHVQAGQLIGLMGASGNVHPRPQEAYNSYAQRGLNQGSHLHFEVRNSVGTRVNPKDYVTSRSGLNVGTSPVLPTTLPSENTSTPILGTATDGLYWNTVMQLWPGDRIKIP